MGFEACMKFRLDFCLGFGHSNLIWVPDLSIYIGVCIYCIIYGICHMWVIVYSGLHLGHPVGPTSLPIKEVGQMGSPHNRRSTKKKKMAHLTLLTIDMHKWQFAANFSQVTSMLIFTNCEKLDKHRKLGT